MKSGYLMLLNTTNEHIIFQMATVTLSVDKQQYKGDFPHFARPEQFGEYCINRERKITLGRLDAKYFFEKAKGVSDFDLNEGYSKFEGKVSVYIMYMFGNRMMLTNT